MATSTLYKWDNTEQYSDNFYFTTRYYDLGDASLLKTIYQISLTTGLNSSGLSGSRPIVVSIDYRLSTNGGWNNYGTYIATNLAGYQENQNTLTITRKNKLSKISGIQLRVTGTIPEGFLINDISIEYRHLRRKNIGRPQ